MIKFKTSRYSYKDDLIKSYEVVKETPKQLTYIGERYSFNLNKNVPYEIKEAKVCESHRWHDTWEDAHQFLIAVAKSKVKSSEDAFNKAFSDLRFIEAMKK